MKIKADFGYIAHETRSPCSNPEYANPRVHRLAIMKGEHFGSKRDRDDGGIPGWVGKYICTGCGKEFRKNDRGFYPEKVLHGYDL